MDHQLTQQRAIDALQRDVCEAHADTLRARGERDKARGEHTRLAGLADGRGYQIEKLEAMVDDLLAACEAARDALNRLSKRDDAYIACCAAIARARGES